MASSSDNSWSWRRATHRVIAGAAGIWMLLLFFTFETESQHDVVLKRHLSSLEHLNLIGGASTLDWTQPGQPQPQRLQSQAIEQVVTSKPQEENITCDFSHFRTDICHLKGDVRVNGRAATVALHSSNSPPNSRVVARVKPYTRKWEESCMKTIGEVKVKAISGSNPTSRSSSCNVRHSVPAVVFSTGGYTGNVYHEFNDGLIPLYITSSKFQGEVVFLILELHDWWMTKYGSVISRLSNYPPLDFDRTSRVHCFPELILGLEIHDELAIKPGIGIVTPPHIPVNPGIRRIPPRTPPSMRGFQQLLKNSWSSGALQPVTPPRGRRPRLVLLSRKGSRALLNRNEVVRLARRVGFEVSTLAPTSKTELWKVHEQLQSAEVLVGVHGAAMTHLLFMRPGSVVIQVVPLGTDWAARTYYGEPAVKAGLRYMEYKISAEESSLVETLGRNHTAVEHPEEITSQGWWEMKKVYLEGQDVRLSLSRFQPVLERAFGAVTGRDGGGGGTGRQQHQAKVSAV